MRAELAVDLLGADHPEQELCRGAAQALLETRADELFLHVCGHPAVICGVMEQYGVSPDRYAAVDAPTAITADMAPAEACRIGDASLVRGLRLCADHPEIGGLITCGVTGAVVMGAITVLGRVGRMRPVLLCELKNGQDRSICLLDCGANVDCRPELYVSFARLGDAYMRAVGCADPRVALLSNGAEDEKGCAAVKAAHALLRREPLHFIGNVEGSDALSGRADVVVCDGFHGNILLKSTEGIARAVIDEVRQRLAAAGVSDPRVEEILAGGRRRYDYNTQGGATLLGVRRPVMKGHGAATGETVRNMIARMRLLAGQDLYATLAEQ